MGCRWTELAETAWHAAVRLLGGADSASVRAVSGGVRGAEATVCYAVKANSSLAILRMLAELGAGFDIVSGGELERVRRARQGGAEAGGLLRRGQAGVGDRRGAEGRDSAVQRGVGGGAGAAGRAGRGAGRSGAVCAAGESGCLCGDASVYLDRAAGAQVRRRDWAGAGDLSARRRGRSGWMRRE